MGAQLALLLCSFGVSGLFYLNREKSVRTSIALWLPVIWLWIVGSRPISLWFGVGYADDNLAATLDGSPVDAAVTGVLLAIGVMVLIHRRKRTTTYLTLIGPVILYFLYTLISVTWAPFFGPALKRWIKDVGDLVMVLIIVTDFDPVHALRQLVSRVGFVLFPFSVVLIRYTDLGRGYTPDGAPMNTGVTTNKNELGLIVFLISIGALWNVRSLLRNKDEPNRRRRLVAQGTLLVFGLALLIMAHSSTALACFIIGSVLMLATSLRALRNRPARVHALCLTILLLGGAAALFGGVTDAARLLGRDSTLSGRTAIWAALLSTSSNPIFGAGFDSFWTSPSALTFQSNLLHWYHAERINEAHNGYIEVYLNLGWLGVGLISLILLAGYRSAVAAFRRSPSIGGLMLAYVASAAFYSLTEAGFRTMGPMWIFLLLATVSTRGVNAGIFGKEAAKFLTSRGGTRKTPAWNELSPGGETFYIARRELAQSEITGTSNLR